MIWPKLERESRSNEMHGWSNTLRVDESLGSEYEIMLAKHNNVKEAHWRVEYGVHHYPCMHAAYGNPFAHLFSRAPLSG